MRKTLLACLLFVTQIVWGQQPKLMLPIGHTAGIRSICFSPDGKKIVTGSIDHTIKIWDAKNGSLLADLVGHTNEINYALFSSDGKKIATASNDSTAKIWDAESGMLLFNLKGQVERVTSISFSPDGKEVVTASFWDPVIKVWSAENGNLLTNLTGHTKGVKSVCFSPDGLKILSASNDFTAKIWNAKNGVLILSLNKHTNWVSSASFSPNGKKIVTSSCDNTAIIWNTESGSVLFGLKEHINWILNASFSVDGKRILTSSSDATAKVWDAESGSLLLDLKQHRSKINSASFSIDDKKIITSSDDRTVKIWDAENGSLIFDFKDLLANVLNASFSNDGKKIITLSQLVEGANVWDAHTFSLLFELKGHTKHMSLAGYSPNGNQIMSFNGRIPKIWNFKNGQILTTLDQSSINTYDRDLNIFNKYHFSPDGEKIAANYFNGALKIWDTKEGSLITNLKAYNHSEYGNVSFSPDGKKILTTSMEQDAKLWDIQNDSLLFIFKGHGDFIGSCFSPDGTKILNTYYDTAEIWDVKSKTLLLDFKLHSPYVSNASFSPDSKMILTVGDKLASVWNIENKQLLFELKTNIISPLCNASFCPDSKNILISTSFDTIKLFKITEGKFLANFNAKTPYGNSFSFSPDGKMVILTCFNQTAKIWNVETGKLVKEIKDTVSDISVAFLSPDGKNILTGSNDNIAKIWDAATGNILYSFFAVDSTDYLIVDKDYHYDGTPAARKLLYYTCGTEVIELQQLKDKLWVPDLSERINKGEKINSPALSDLNICGLTAELEDVGDIAGSYKFKITPRGGGLGETVLYINNNETRRYKPEQVVKTDDGYILTIPRDSIQPYLVPGNFNPVSLKTFTKENDILSRGLIIVADETKKKTQAPNLYAVIVGVSEYKAAELSLNYAAKDAQDIGNVIALSAKKLLNQDSNEHVFLFNLNTGADRYSYPDKESIRLVFDSIAKRAVASDILLVFFAGHGTVEVDKNNQKQFYFLTADASSFINVEANGISTKELIEWIQPQKIKAQKRILILDACNSGQALNDISGNTNLMAVRSTLAGDEKKEIERLNDRAGMFILSASASNQNAYEVNKYSQGLLTYTLLKAIKQQPDILEDSKYLNLSRWFSAAKKSVSDIMNESGNNGRQEPQIVSNTNFNLGIVDEQVMAKIVLPQEKPLFTGSNFQNSDASGDDNLELTQQINLQLNDLSARGTESKIVYTTATNSPDAYTLVGRYEVKGNIVTIKVSIKQNKEIKQRFELSGTKNKLNELAAAVVEKAAGMVK